MFSKKKPPLPSWSIIEERPDLFCLNYNSTKERCNAQNLKRDKCNAQSWEDFRKKFSIWKSSY